jgi:hypothetical protein
VVVVVAVASELPVLVPVTDWLACLPVLEPPEVATWLVE